MISRRHRMLQCRLPILVHGIGYVRFTSTIELVIFKHSATLRTVFFEVVGLRRIGMLLLPHFIMRLKFHGCYWQGNFLITISTYKHTLVCTTVLVCIDESVGTRFPGFLVGVLAVRVNRPRLCRERHHRETKYQYHQERHESLCHGKTSFSMSGSWGIGEMGTGYSHG